MADTLDVTSMLPNTFEPKRKFRWILRIEGIDSFLISTAGRPKFTTGEVEIGWINSTRYLAGKTKFEPMEVTLHDPIAPSGAQQIMEWIRLHFESVSGRSGYADFYKRDLQLCMLDSIGTVCEQWDVKGAWLTSVDYGDLDMAADDVQMITLSIRFDNAVLQF